MAEEENEYVRTAVNSGGLLFGAYLYDRYLLQPSFDLIGKYMGYNEGNNVVDAGKNGGKNKDDEVDLFDDKLNNGEKVRVPNPDPDSQTNWQIKLGDDHVVELNPYLIVVIIGLAFWLIKHRHFGQK